MADWDDEEEITAVTEAQAEAARQAMVDAGDARLAELLRKYVTDEDDEDE